MKESGPFNSLFLCYLNPALAPTVHNYIDLI